MVGQYLSQAFSVVFSLYGFVALTLSVFLGLIFGMLPGLTATMAVALLTGLTYSFDGPLAVMVLIGVYIGSISGGCQSAILLNIPGTPASAATAVDGFPLARKGKGGLAIFVANMSSFSGTILSVAYLLLFTPLLTSAALKFNSHEMFLLAVFGIIICGNLTSGGRPIKGWISGFVGLLISQVGRDTVGSFARFTFGVMNLTGGISLLPVMIGLFGFPEIVASFSAAKRRLVNSQKYKAREGFAVYARNWFNVLRSSVLGMVMGAIPGVGEDTGGWLSYWAQKRSSKNPEEYGRGCIDGVVSAETGNNAAIGGAIIPVLSLGIPGSAPAAVLLAAFVMHGYRPGPLLLDPRHGTPEFLYYVVVFMVVSSVLMWLIASNISRLSVRVLRIDQRVLMPTIFIMSVIGAFVVNNRVFDVKLMFVFGMLGVAMRYMKYPSAPFLLGVILGNMADDNLRRALNLHNGSIMPFFTRPISI
ncbi:MAG TPA: tripartite tricarboxylate transporter permease, partial [Candidatus Limnocylindria bacterium]|nr:tripartite tricarboxylate transporter permease [Candidatus Limnocylindria bacterium]